MSVIVASLFCAMAFCGVLMLSMNARVSPEKSALVAAAYCYIAMRIAFNFARRNPELVYDSPFYVRRTRIWAFHLLCSCLWPLMVLALIRELADNPGMRKKLRNASREDVKDFIQSNIAGKWETLSLIIFLTALVIATILLNHFGWPNRPVF